MNHPMLSVIIPVYNGEVYIRAALESVLRQGDASTEVIVVNDGSTDATQDILASFGERIQVLHQANRGPSAARNAGVRASHGTYIGLLDADDLWPDGRTQLALAHLSRESADFVRGKTVFIEEGQGSAHALSEPVFMEALVGAGLYKRHVFERAGWFDEEMRCGEDIDWHLRLVESGCVEYRIQETMLIYRRHMANMTRSEDVLKKGQLDALRKKLARARTRTHAQNTDAYASIR